MGIPKTWSAGEQVTATDINSNFSYLNARNEAAARVCRITSNQSVSSGSTDKVQFNSETYDVLSNFDSATNYRFTCPTTGHYMVSATLGLLSHASSPTYNIKIYIYVNGAEYSRNVLRHGDAEVGIGQGMTSSVSITDIVNITANDYIEIFVVGTNASGSFGVVLGSNVSFMSVHKLS